MTDRSSSAAGRSSRRRARGSRTSPSTAGGSPPSSPTCRTRRGRRRGRRRDRAARPPRRRRRPHPHPRRVRRRARSVLPGFGGGGVRRHDDVPVVQQPGHGIVARGRALAADRASASGAPRPTPTAPIDYGLSLAISGHATTRSPSCPRRSTPASRPSKAFMVFDFRLRRRASVRGDARHRPSTAGCSRSTARTRSCSTPPSRARLQRGDTAPRYHATTRPTDVEAVATAPGAGVRARRPTRRSTSSTCRRRRRSTRSGARKAAGVRVARRDLPALPRPDRRALRRARSRPVRRLRHLAAAPLRRRPRRAVGGPRRRRRSTSSRPTTSPTASRSRRPRPRAGVPFDQISNGAPGHRDAARDRLQRGRRQGPDHARADGRPAGDDAGPPVRARDARARSRSAATPTSSCSIRPPGGRSAPPTSTTPSDYTPYEGLEVTGAVRGVFVRGRRSSATAPSSADARRTAGFVERERRSSR